MEVVKKRKVWRGRDGGVYIPVTRTLVSKAVKVKLQLRDIAVNYLNTSLKL